MDRSEKSSHWIIYRMTRQELAEKLGISESIISISVGNSGLGVEVYTSAESK